MKCLCCLCVGGCVDMHTWEKNKTLIRMRCLPPFHVFLRHRVAVGGGWGRVWLGQRCHLLTKDMDIEQDKTLTFHQHLSCAPLFFSPSLFFLLTWWWHSPELWHTQSVLGGSATSQRHTHMATGDGAKWAEERYLSSLHVVGEPRAACFNPGHSSLLQPLNTVFLSQTPLSYGSFNDLCYAVWNTCTQRLSWNQSLVSLLEQGFLSICVLSLYISKCWGVAVWIFKMPCACPVAAVGFMAN